MHSKSSFLATTLLTGILGVIASGCYTIIAVDNSSAPAEAAVPDPVPIFVAAPPPPPPLVDVPAPAQWAVEPSPSVTTQRTSGPQHDGNRTQSPPPTAEQRPVRTGRGH